MDYRYWNAKSALYRAVRRVEGVSAGLDGFERSALQRAAQEITDNLSVLLQYSGERNDEQIGEVDE